MTHARATLGHDHSLSPKLCKAKELPLLSEHHVRRRVTLLLPADGHTQLEAGHKLTVRSEVINTLYSGGPLNFSTNHYYLCLLLDTDARHKIFTFPLFPMTDNALQSGRSSQPLDSTVQSQNETMLARQSRSHKPEDFPSVSSIITQTLQSLKSHPLSTLLRPEIGSLHAIRRLCHTMCFSLSVPKSQIHRSH